MAFSLREVIVYERRYWFLTELESKSQICARFGKKRKKTEHTRMAHCKRELYGEDFNKRYSVSSQIKT